MKKSTKQIKKQQIIYKRIEKIFFVSIICIFFVVLIDKINDTAITRNDIVCGQLEANLWILDDDGQPNNQYSKSYLAYESAGCN